MDSEMATVGTNLEATTWPIPFLSIHTRELKPHPDGNLYVNILTALLIIAKSWKQPSVHQMMDG